MLVSVKDNGDGKANYEDFTGLGLSIADEMLRLMGSDLHAINEAGEGSELYFEIEQVKA